MKRTHLMIAAVVASALAMTACDRKSETERYRDGSTAQIVESITSTDKNVDLVLTTRSVYMQLSDEMLEKVQDELDENRPTEDDGELSSTIKNAVIDNVEDTLAKRIEYPLDEVNAIYWKDDTIVVDVEDEHAVSFDDVSIDGKPAMEGFKESDARDLIDAFDRLKDNRA